MTRPEFDSPIRRLEDAQERGRRARVELGVAADIACREIAQLKGEVERLKAELAAARPFPPTPHGGRRAEDFGGTGGPGLGEIMAEVFDETTARVKAMADETFSDIRREPAAAPAGGPGADGGRPAGSGIIQEALYDAAEGGNLVSEYHDLSPVRPRPEPDEAIRAGEPAEGRPLVESIRARREGIGPVGLDIGEALRGMRGDSGDEPGRQGMADRCEIRPGAVVRPRIGGRRMQVLRPTEFTPADHVECGWNAHDGFFRKQPIPAEFLVVVEDESPGESDEPHHSHTCAAIRRGLAKCGRFADGAVGDQVVKAIVGELHAIHRETEAPRGAEAPARVPSPGGDVSGAAGGVSGASIESEPA